MEKYLKKLIEEGENQHLDFKYCISDSRKIARTLVAFANTGGGKLLIGVRDNGSIAGIKSEEEIYMVGTAVELYCRPNIVYSVKQHKTEGKDILEVVVERGTRKEYQAKDEDGRWRFYFRNGAQNLVANRVMLRLWKKEEYKSGAIVRFGKPENLLMEYLSANKVITLSGFRRIAGINTRRAEAILVNLLLLKVIRINASETGFLYELNPDEPILPESRSLI